MNTITARAVAAAVTGARHLRIARNGQDAAAAWTGDRTGAIVVCDGCSAGASSEVGARFGAQLVLAALATRLAAGDRPARLWSDVRAGVGATLAALVAAMPGDRTQIVHDYFLFTVVAAAWSGDEVAVWALGDGAYSFGGEPRVLGPFAENQPPYLAYDLVGAAQLAHLEVRDARCGSVIVATDGVAELGLAGLTNEPAVARYLAHPDALRRQLAVQARNTERIDWDTRRIQRQPAALQDDGAVALLRWAS